MFYDCKVGQLAIAGVLPDFLKFIELSRYHSMTVKCRQ